jgi:hypothetical protein
MVRFPYTLHETSEDTYLSIAEEQNIFTNLMILSEALKQHVLVLVTFTLRYL